MKHPDKQVQERYIQVLQLAQLPAFREGKTFDLCYCQDDDHFDKDRHYAWLRSDGKNTWLLVSNFSDWQAQITIRIPPEALEYLGIQAVRTVYTLSVEGKDYKIQEVN